jgi:hypothetical protein
VLAEAVVERRAAVERRAVAEQVERQPSLSVRRLIHPLSKRIQGWAMTGIQRQRRRPPQAEVDEAGDVAGAAAEQVHRRLP